MVLLPAKIAAFITFFGLPQALGYASAYHTRKYARDYYPALKKPSWAPPPALLKPIWVIIYACIGFASYLVWRQKFISGANIKLPLILYSASLFFNVFWSPLFFRIKSPFAALACIFLNLVTAALATTLFAPISPTAFKLMVPYVGFLFISGYLNKTVWRLNTAKPKKKTKKVKIVSESDSDSD